MIEHSKTVDLCNPYRNEFYKTEVFLELQSSSEPAIPVRHEAVVVLINFTVQKALQSEHGVPVSKACKKLEPNVTSSPLPIQRTAMELLDFQIVPGIETSSVRFIRTVNTTAESSSTSNGDSNNLSDTSGTHRERIPHDIRPTRRVEADAGRIVSRGFTCIICTGSRDKHL
ncbi:hypothetical protein GQX74_011201 [Glossina fuscipes]|nr:hypothetical protein GQX74_011201 [Glossina fuscipes]